VLARREAAREARNQPLYNAALIAAQKTGDLAAVMDVYDRMQAEGLFPTAKTFRILIRSCEEAGDLEALRNFEQLEQQMRPLLQLGDVDIV